MSIKVAVRVRPFNDREMKGNSGCCVKMVSIDIPCLVSIFWQSNSYGLRDIIFQ